MNDAKNIYSSELNVAVSVRAVPKLAAVSNSKKSVFKRIADFLVGPDLDLATFERIEGISCAKERDIHQQWRFTAGRF